MVGEAPSAVRDNCGSSTDYPVHRSSVLPSEKHGVSRLDNESNESHRLNWLQNKVALFKKGSEKVFGEKQTTSHAESKIQVVSIKHKCFCQSS